jgi:alkanesulfonate monooxygenase SsuD/methylene tetrahydromethanopterin reductase-like flavin-dependent oxidoreductase (luciferase family)
MKFALVLPDTMCLKALTQRRKLGVTGPKQAVVARRAEELGYDMINIPQQFAVPNSQVEWSGAHYFHSTVMQAHVSGATQRIRMNSCIRLQPLQHPIIMAKALSTADWMSNGRVTVTFGVGWEEKEFDALGGPYQNWGHMADEYLAAIVELWTSDSPTFDGDYVSFDDVGFEPTPLQTPHLPIWIGGDAEPVLRRAARFASGWFPRLTKPEDIPAKLDFIKSQPTYKGGPFEVAYSLSTALMREGHAVVDDTTQRPSMGAQEIIDRLGWLKDLGVTFSSVPMPPVNDVNAYLDYAQWMIEEIKPKVQ